MERGSVSAIILTVLLAGMLPSVLRIEVVEASGTIYIRSDGSIDPPTAPILTVDNVTYTFADDVCESIVVGRDNIVINGADYTLQGGCSKRGIDLSNRNNVTVTNTTISQFDYGIYLESSSNSTIFGNNITASLNDGISLNESSNNNIFRNNITASSLHGIYLVHSSNNSLSRNTMTENNVYSISLQYSQNNSITENNITDSMSGVDLEYSSDNIITENLFIRNGLVVWNSYGNIVDHNMVNDKSLVHLEGAENVSVREAGQVILVNCNNMTVENLNLSFTSIGIQLCRTNNTKIAHNNITDNNWHGVHIWESRKNNVTDNHILGNYHSGVFFEYSLNNTVTGNNITDNYDGLGLWYSSNNTIAGNSITNNWYGIYLLLSSDNSVSGNNMVGNGDGIRFESFSNYNSITGNNIADNDYGVCLYGSSNNVIFGNEIVANNWCGICLEGSSSNTVSENNITDNYLGVSLYDSSTNAIFGNNIVMNNWDGIHLESSSDNIIIENGVAENNGYGICLDWFCSGNGVFHNEVRSNNCYGILLSQSSNNDISENMFVDGGFVVEYSCDNVVVGNWVNGKPLVYLEAVSDMVVEEAGQVILVNCNRIKVRNLNIFNTTIGVQLWQTNNTEISGNNITGNSHSGICLVESLNNSIFGNNMANNWDGIMLSGSKNNTIRSNNIFDNTLWCSSGVKFLYGSNNNHILRNNLANNTVDIFIYMSSENAFYHNNFQSGAIKFTSETANVWDDECEGNYWVDYNVTDSDGDGISDMPYIIDENNTDRYPLMNPYWSPCDINHDLKVDMEDVGTAARAFGSQPGDARWNCHADINGSVFLEPDDQVNMRDVALIARNFGKAYRQ